MLDRWLLRVAAVVAVVAVFALPVRAQTGKAQLQRGLELKQNGKLDQAIEVLRAAARHLEAAGKLEPAAAACEAVAECCEKRQGHRDALAMWRRALKLRRRVHGENDAASVGKTLNRLGVCLLRLGRAREALPEFEAALAMKERLFEGDHSDVASSLNSVAVCLEVLGRAQDALPKFESALAMNQRLFEGDHPYIASSLNNLAYCLEALGRAQEARPSRRSRRPSRTAGARRGASRSRSGAPARPSRSP